MMFLRLIRTFRALYLLWLAVGAFVHGQALGAAQDYVVMVEARQTRGSGQDFGAGLVVGQTPERTVIVTALHVVANEAGILAPEITVEFSTRRGRFYKASASPRYIDRALDLAVLIVEHDLAGVPPDVLKGSAIAALSPTPAAQLTGARVSLIGSMNQRRWAHGPLADIVVGSTAQQLRVRSGEAAGGASGGGIFDSFGRLLGMASSIDSSNGDLLVLPMSAVIARLRRWEIQTTLETAQLASTDDGLLAQMKKELRFAITYLEPGPTAPGGLWPAATGFRHRLQAVLSPSLRELNPLVRLSFPDHPHLTAYTPTRYDLKAPNYVLEESQVPMVLKADAVLILPDRRQIGPVSVQLDFATGPESAAQKLGDSARESVVSARNQFEFQKRESEAARKRGTEATKEVLGNVAVSAASSMRATYFRAFPHLRMRCEKGEEKWLCRKSKLVPVPPYGVRLDSLLHGLKMGNSERDLSITFPLDPEFNIVEEFSKQAALLLDDGAKELYVWMRLSTGEALGPQRVCEVSTKRRGKETVCD